MLKWQTETGRYHFATHGPDHYGITDSQDSGLRVVCLCVAALDYSKPDWTDHVSYHATIADAQAAAQEHADHGVIPVSTPEPTAMGAIRKALAETFHTAMVACGLLPAPKPVATPVATGGDERPKA